jgi:hypothetical protein
METLNIMAHVETTLRGQNIKEEDIPSFEISNSLGMFLAEVYSFYPEAYKEALWQSVDNRSLVAYSKQKPDGSYIRVATTIGRWLRRIDLSIDDNLVKILSERYKASAVDASWLTLQVCQDEADIVHIYADDTICDSCMSNETAVAVYDSPDIEVVYASYEGTIVGRAVCNKATKEYVRAYPTGDKNKYHEGLDDNVWRKLFLSLLEKEGYTANKFCLSGCRLRYIGGDSDGLYMPYLDGAYDCVYWEGGSEFATICEEDYETYKCNNTNGFSEPLSEPDHTGQVCIDGEWYNEDDVCYSSYNEEYILADDAYFSDFDTDYFYDHQVIAVTRFSRYNREGYDDSVHESNCTIEVVGLDYPILEDELSLWETSNRIVEVDGTYYVYGHPDVAWCEEEERHVLITA